MIHVGPVDSRELADRLAPLANSTPEEKRRRSEPTSSMARTSSADSPFSRRYKNSLGGMLGVHVHEHVLSISTFL